MSRPANVWNCPRDIDPAFPYAFENKVSQLPDGQGFNAASVAWMVLTTETAVVDKPADFRILGLTP